MKPFDFSWMVGHQITRVKFSEPTLWHFSFEEMGGISAESPWRIIEHGRIVLSSDDHRQQFGLPAPIDAVERASSMLAGSEVIEVNVMEGTADLIVSLTRDMRLEIIPFSSGYEGWQVTCPTGEQIIAQGGGQLSTWKR